MKVVGAKYKMSFHLWTVLTQLSDVLFGTHLKVEVIYFTLSEAVVRCDSKSKLIVEAVWSSGTVFQTD